MSLLSPLLGKRDNQTSEQESEQNTSPVDVLVSGRDINAFNAPESLKRGEDVVIDDYDATPTDTPQECFGFALFSVEAGREVSIVSPPANVKLLAGEAIVEGFVTLSSTTEIVNTDNQTDAIGYAVTSADKGKRVEVNIR